MKGDLYTKNERVIKKITIGKNKYKVYLVDTLKLNNKNYIGFVDYQRKEIFLKKNRLINETLRHEISHIILNEIYLKSNKNKRIIKKLRSNEFFINSLTELIRQNFNLK